MSNQFEITQARTEEPLAVLRLKGRIEHAAATELRSACSKLRDDGYSELVINLADVPFVSSSGIGLLVMISDRFMRIGGSVRFACLPTPVMDVMKLLHIDRYLNFYDSEENAIQGTKEKAK